MDVRQITVPRQLIIRLAERSDIGAQDRMHLISFAAEVIFCQGGEKRVVEFLKTCPRELVGRTLALHASKQERIELKAKIGPFREMTQDLILGNNSDLERHRPSPFKQAYIVSKGYAIIYQISNELFKLLDINISLDRIQEDEEYASNVLAKILRYEYDDLMLSKIDGYNEWVEKWKDAVVAEKIEI